MMNSQDSKNIVVIASFAESLINFRGPLLATLVERGHRVTVCAPDFCESVRKNLRDLGAESCSIPLDRTGMNAFKDAKFVFTLTKLFRKLRPDVVLAYTIKPVIYGSLAALVTRVPETYSIITGLGSAFPADKANRSFLGWVVEQLYRLSLRRNARVFFQNPDDLALFRDRGIVKAEWQTTLINGSGVDLRQFGVAPIPEKTSFLMICRLLHAKGIHEYIEAARIIRRKHPSIIFRLVGWIDKNPDSIDESDLGVWVEKGVVDYLGELRDVRPAIANSSVFVLPSYREGVPRTILEAMAMGRPIITTDAPGCRETVEEGRNGFLVPVRNVDALARAMEEFIKNPGLIERMGAESHAIASKKFDVHKVNESILRGMELF